MAGGRPLRRGRGPYGIELLGGVGAGLQNGVAVSVNGGTVPASTTRVVISDRRGETTEAELVEGGDDPTRQYFAGALPRVRVRRHDRGLRPEPNQEVARFVSPV